VVRFADGTELRIPAAQPHPSTLDRLHAKECAAAAVQEAVQLLADDWVRDGDTADGTLSLPERGRSRPAGIGVGDSPDVGTGACRVPLARGR